MVVDAPGEAGLEKLVVAAIRRHANIQTTIVPLVIEKTGWDWERCEQYIDQMQKDHAAEISFWQSNVFTILGWIFIAAGFAIILIAVNAYIGFDRLIDCVIYEIQKSTITFNECMYSGLMSLEGLYDFGVVGITIILGGVAGIIFARHQLNKGEVMRND